MLPSRKKISVVGFCSGLGQRREGLEQAPEVLRSHGLLQSLALDGHELEDRGDLIPQGNRVWEILERLRSTNLSALRAGFLPLTLGGDHSLAIATIQATLSVYPETRIVWVDAHGDMNTPETSSSGNLHGMPLAALLGLFTSPLIGPRLSSENLLMIGVRDLDKAERNFIADLKIRVISSSEIKDSPDNSLREIKSWIASQPDRPIHLSLDIDAMDPVCAPATGLPVADGMEIDFARQVMKEIRETGCLVAIDFVELNPLSATSVPGLQKTIDCAKVLLRESLGDHETKEI